MKPPSTITMRALAAVCDRFGVTPQAVLSRDRREPLASYRLLGMAVAREAGDTTVRVAEGFNRRDHVTVLYAAKVVAQRRSIEPETESHFRGLLETVAAAENLTTDGAPI